MNSFKKKKKGMSQVESVCKRYTKIGTENNFTNN